MGVIGAIIYAVDVNGTPVHALAKKSAAEVAIRPSDRVADAIVLSVGRHRLTVNGEELKTAIASALEAQITLFRMGGANHD